MLKLPRFSQQTSKYSACRQCISRIPQLKSTNRPDYVIPVPGLDVSRRLFSTDNFRRALRQGNVSESKNAPFIFNPPPKPSNFREQLQKWETENAVSSALPADDLVESMQDRSTIKASTGFLDTDIVAPDEGVTDDGAGDTLAFNYDELVEIGNLRTILIPGDLVELRFTGNSVPELAVFVRKLDKQLQFYGMSGRYVHRAKATSVRFFVPSFVKSEELDPILPFLPDTDISQSFEDRLQSFKENVPRDVGRPLVRKLAAFLQQSEAAYLSLASRLDHAHSLLADKGAYKYATLDEIANTLVSPLHGPKEGNEFPAPVLYAVHRSIMDNDTGIRISQYIIQRTAADYEIISMTEMDNLRWVAQQVRQYREDILNGTKRSLLHKFIPVARVRIDKSRKFRAFTPHGRLGVVNRETPGDNNSQHSKADHSSFRETKSFLRFLESWVCLDSIKASSPMSGIGSTILRAIDRYDGFDLDQTTGWTLLQEMGYISPWETKASFELRLPNVSRNTLSILSLDSTEGFVEDKLQDIRKDWLDLPVFCVDDVGAHELDDGISIEDTDVPGEYWVHAHIADPAAHIDPKSSVAAFAASLGGTIYLPDRVVPMLRQDFVHDRLSLGPGRPCVTFSARMNMEGDILGNKVAAGVIRNVTFLTPDTLKEITGGPGPTACTVGVVGADMPTLIASRELTSSLQLSESQKADLRRLHQIAMARENQLFAKGRVTTEELRPSVEVSLKGLEWHKEDNPTCVRYHGDPTIKVTAPQITNPELRVINYHGNTVMCLMLIANEVAAQWCHARGIPIPNRITPNNPMGSSITDYFHNTFLPAVDKTGAIHQDIFMEYHSRAGNTALSTTPGPHVQLAVKMIAKCTSPLRRYADLLLHWQVGAALLRESQTGESLIGNTEDDFLPFSKSELDVILPRVANRERIANRGMRRAQREWSIHFLLRLWKSQDSNKPLLLKFHVRTVYADRTVGGIIEDFLIGAKMDKNFDLPDSLPWDELKPGDRFEVELTDINVYECQVAVRFLRQLGKQ